MNKLIKQLFILLWLCSSINITSAQITFQKTYGGISAFGDHGSSVQQTMDGGYIITGVTNSLGAGNQDVYLIKTNANGDTLWTKTFGESTTHEEGSSVQQTSDGGYIISGLKSSSVTEGVYLIKTDANGDSLWANTFGQANGEIGNSVQQTTDGGYIIAGVTYNSSTGDVYLIKTNANGNLLWSKNFGGTNYESGYSVQQTTDGGYIITGNTTSFGAGNPDVYLIKTDSTGNLLWSKTFGGTDYDAGNSVQQTSDGGYIIAGSTRSFGAGNQDVYLIKTDSTGNLLWSKTFGQLDYDVGSSVRQTTDGGYIITGSTKNAPPNYESVYVIKTDVSGNPIWTKTYGEVSPSGTSYGYGVKQTSDGGYIICGEATMLGSPSPNVYLIKTDSAGISNCYQGIPATIVTTPTTIVTSPATIVTSPPTSEITPLTIVSSGGTIVTLCTTVGLAPSPLESVGVRLTPNPSSGNFTITLPYFISEGEVEIYNAYGAKIFTELISTASQKEIHLKTPQGIYFIKVVEGEKQYSGKIILE